MIRRVRDISFRWPRNPETPAELPAWVEDFQAEMDKHMQKLAEVADGIKYLAIPVRSTAERDAYTFWKRGEIIWNSTAGVPQIYDGSGWRSINIT